jgi:uncharacterized protein (TIGR03083 family)
VPGLPADRTAEALRAETVALTAVSATLPPADLGRPSPCPPWTVADLLGHIVIGAGRIGPAIAAATAAVPASELITAAGYYRPDARFSAAANAARTDVAAALADRLGTAAAITAELTAACEHSLHLLESAPAGLQVRTRHGDPMLLAEFAVTRVVELAVHGLDLASGLDHSPWLTGPAAAVLEGLLLPGAGEAELAGLRARLGCDRTGLIARLTGRTLMSPGDAALLAGLGFAPLALG